MDDIKREMKERARVARGLANALGYDMDYVHADVNNYDLICLGESIRETKDTLQRLTDAVTELEYLAYLLKKEDSR